MTINQMQLNHIIDLLGDWVFALRFNLTKPVQEKSNCKGFFDKDYRSYIEPSDADHSIPDIQAAKKAYYQALSALYVNQEIPSVFTEQLRIFGNGSHSHNQNDWWGRESIVKAHIEIAIAEVVGKLNVDFNSTENIEEQTSPLTYTGTRYKSYQNDRIFVGVQKSIKDSGNMPKTNFYFVMAVLSDPSTLLLAALLVPVSCVLFASDEVVPGTIAAVAAVSIASCFAAKRFGLFAENNGTDPNITIDPYALANIIV